MTPAALLLLVYALAAARVTVLVTEDRITEAPRQALLRRMGERAVARCLAEARAEYRKALEREMSADEAADFRVMCKRQTAERTPYLAYLLTCQWCAGFWVAAPAAAAWYWMGDNPWTLLPAAALAISYVTGKLAQLGG